MPAVQSTKAAAAVADGSADQGFRNTGLGEGRRRHVGRRRFRASTPAARSTGLTRPARRSSTARSTTSSSRSRAHDRLVGLPDEERASHRHRGARYAEFAAGTIRKIYWTPQTGARVVRGPFAAALADPPDRRCARRSGWCRRVNSDIITQKFANGTLTFDANRQVDQPARHRAAGPRCQSWVA